MLCFYRFKNVCFTAQLKYSENMFFKTTIVTIFKKFAGIAIFLKFELNKTPILMGSMVYQN